MFKWVAITLTCISSISSLFADCCGGTCCQSVDVEIGWRRDSLDWKLSDLESSYVSGEVKDRILFKDINSYTISGQAKWVASSYYVRLSAEYGTTDKGRAREHFNIDSPLFYSPISVETSDPIKRRSEVYDFDAALGYPLEFCNCRLSVIPLIGFSFHRQHLRVKHERECSSGSCSYNDNSSDSSFSSSSFSSCSSSSSSFLVDCSNPFISHQSENPFSSPTDPEIANELGLIAPHETSNYRFTWYGFYVGADIAYALDNCWTLFWDTEFHFLDNCHRKRDSLTGVYFVDDYHEKGYAYGFNNVVGITYYIANCWYTTLSVDFNWWKADSKHDELHWKKVGAKIGFAYSF